MSAATPGFTVYNGQIPEYDLPHRGMEPGVSFGSGREREVAVWVTDDQGTQRTFRALPDRCDGSEPDADGPGSAESEAAVQDGPQDLPCGHAPVYAESGTCMACEPAVGNVDDGITGELVRDQWGGRP